MTNTGLDEKFARRHVLHVTLHYALWSLVCATVLANLLSWLVLGADLYVAIWQKITLVTILTTLATVGLIFQRLQPYFMNARINQQASLSDFLTGIGNRASFYAQMARHVDARPDAMPEGAVICVDIDNFKGINDRFGHICGDRVLIEIARRLAEAGGAGDVVARFGGDEFMLAFPHMTLAEGCALAHDLRRRIAETTVSTDRGEIAVTASFGVVACAGGRSLDALITEVDQALYEAKGAGRNRVMCRGRETCLRCDASAVPA